MDAIEAKPITWAEYRHRRVPTDLNAPGRLADSAPAPISVLCAQHQSLLFRLHHVVHRLPITKSAEVSRFVPPVF